MNGCKPRASYKLKDGRLKSLKTLYEEYGYE
nr:MAG TPA: hypothetical protein [Caudoviricetes sp.]DAW65354.1 MAG TPA: hypothetical protein [Caudoviricetes sp.]